MSSFQNWSGSVKFKPQKIIQPTSEKEIQDLVKDCKAKQTKIRVVGTGHSFTPLIETQDCLISLDRLQGLIEVEANTGHATLWAGTKLWQLNELLFKEGRALENLGDIDRQSIAGTISTGTHGTGETFGTVSTQVEEITFVNGLGEIVVCSETKEPTLFKAAQVSLGSLGIITRIKLRTLPAYKLKLVQKKITLDECLATLEADSKNNRHFEFYYFPYSPYVQSKLVNITNEAPQGKTLGGYLNDIVLENGVFKILSEISRWIPGTTRAIAWFCGFGVGGAVKVNWAHRIFSMPRLVKFQEMEFNVPRENLAPVLKELASMIETKKIRVHFPIECRYVKADNIWLSPAFGRDSAYLAIHMYKGMPHQEYFDAAQVIFRKYGGRPHWGKMHTLSATELSPLYPMWDSFQKVRETMDPDGIFLNPALQKLFMRKNTP